MRKKGWSPLHGIICLWHGQLEDIPDGWAVCNGENGTPDLINLFVRGAADWQPPGTRVGDWGHTHDGYTDQAEDTLVEGYTIPDVAGEGNFLPEISGHEHHYTTAQTNHIPPAMHLYWIMKL